MLYPRQVLAHMHQCSYFLISVANKSLMCLCLPPPPHFFPSPLRSCISLSLTTELTLLPNNKPWLHERSLHWSLSAGVLHFIWFHFMWPLVCNFLRPVTCVWYSVPLLLQCFPLLSHLNLPIIFWQHCFKKKLKFEVIFGGTSSSFLVQLFYVYNVVLYSYKKFFSF